MIHPLSSRSCPRRSVLLRKPHVPEPSSRVRYGLTLQAQSLSTASLEVRSEQDIDWDNFDWREYADESPGPAFLYARSALQWDVVCSHVASFASTLVGKRLCADMEVAVAPDRACALQQETKAVSVLELQLNTQLDFGGISTDAAETAIRRANKGGLIAGGHALGVMSLCEGAENLQRLLRKAKHAAQGTQQLDDIQELVSSFVEMSTFPSLADDIAAAVSDQGEVKDSASDAVRRTRGACATLEGRLRKALAKLPGDITTHAGRMCAAVPAGASSGGGLVLGSGAGVQYIEPGSAVALNNSLIAARAEALAAEEAVLASLTQAVGERAEDLTALLAGVGRLDAARARSWYTEWISGTYPTFVPFPWEAGGKHGVAAVQAAAVEENGGREEGHGKWVHLVRLRHPVLHGWYLQQLAAWRKQSASSSTANKQFTNRKPQKTKAAPELEKPSPVVPINLSVSSDTRCVIITGPNTGGKTATLKALGLSALLAQSGCGVPARGPVRLPVFSAVLADIGDSQGLAASLSTFSGHLRRISAARAESDARSLMLLDELGTGTDPVEGSALAAALLSRLVEGGPGGAGLTAATTHMSALARLKFEDGSGRFENASAEFDEVKLAPTYRLLWGVPGRSCALAISQRLGVPTTVIAAAKDVLGSSQVKMEGLVGQLEALRGDVDASEAAAEDARSRCAAVAVEAEAAEGRAEALRAEEQVTRAAVVAPAATAAVKRLRAAQSRMAHEEKQRAQQEKKKKRGKKAARAKAVAIEEKLAEQKSADWRPQEGEVVEVRKLGGTGRVVAVKGSKVTVALGHMPVTVKVSEVVQV